MSPGWPENASEKLDEVVGERERQPDPGIVMEDGKDGKIISSDHTNIQIKKKYLILDFKPLNIQSFLTETHTRITKVKEVNCSATLGLGLTARYKLHRGNIDVQVCCRWLELRHRETLR